MRRKYEERSMNIPWELLETYPDDIGRQKIDDYLARVVGNDEKCGVPPCVCGYRIGRSILSRPIEAYIVGNGRRRVAFFGAHHALETVTANVLYAFVYMLLTEKRLCGVDVAALLDSVTFYIVPMVDPDGAELVHNGCKESPMAQRLMAMSRGSYDNWQANARGVDLNHNYDFRFAEYKRVEADRGICPGARLWSGEYPESEPESHAVASLVRALSPSLVLSLHTQGEEVYCGLADSRGEKLGSLAADLCGYRFCRPTDTARFGGLCDYTGSLGIPSLTLELGRGVNPLPQSAARSCLLRVLPCLVRLPLLISK